MGIPIDTLAYARRLREVGFTEEQANGQAEALAAAMTDTLATTQDLREFETRIDGQFAGTKRDLQEVKQELKQEVRELAIRIGARFEQIDIRLAEQETRTEIRFSEQSARFDVRLADLERRVTLRLGAMIVASVGAVSALVKLL